MNDEIKEILDGFDKCLKNYELDKAFGQLPVESIYHLFPHKQLLLKDYITNLQQEKEHISKVRDEIIEKYNELQQEKEDYKSRCEKAIEYILNNMQYDDNIDDNWVTTNDLLDILQNGGDSQ